MRLPTITTPIRMIPCATRARFVSRLRKVMSDRISDRMRTATIGPKTPPRPPAGTTHADKAPGGPDPREDEDGHDWSEAAASATGQADATENDGRHAEQRVRPRY